MMRKSLFVAVSAAFLATSAFAGNTGYYAFGGLSYSHADADVAFEPREDDPAVFTTDKDNKNLGAKLAIGYRFCDYFALEGAYTYLGKAKFSSFESYGQYEDFEDKGSIEGHMLSVDALTYLPLTENFDAFAKVGVGVARVKTKYTTLQNDFSTNTPTFTPSDFFSDSKTRFVPKLGVGAEWKVTDQFAIRAEYERLFNVSKDSDESVKADYNLVTVGVKYNF